MSGLKTALLEFCKRQCPGDKELFTLIALHFLLYKEIAFKWESEAKEIINELVAEARKTQAKSSSTQQTLLKLSRNENVEQKLQVIVENFTHATEYYLQVRFRKNNRQPNGAFFLFSNFKRFIFPPGQ